MAIMADICSSWTIPKGIQKYGKVVNLPINGLNIDWMSWEKIKKAGMLIASNNVAAYHPKAPLIKLLTLETQKECLEIQTSI